MHRIWIAGVGLLAMAVLPLHVSAQQTKTIKDADKGGTNYPGSANGGVWKNSNSKDGGKPASGTRVRPGPGYDVGPNKKN
jgi:hypothetical protein